MGQESIGKILVQQISDNFRDIKGAFDSVHNDVSGIYKLAQKNEKKIRGLKRSVFLLGIGVIILASELAERKRSENYLKSEIDELKTKIEDQGNKISKIDDDVAELGIIEGLNRKMDDETDGGAADA